MSPKEIIGRLQWLKVRITDRTLYNYSEWGLIPKPQRGAGRSGKWVEYPDETIAEAYAAWRLLHGDYWTESSYTKLGLKPPKMSPEMVAMVRKLKLEIDSQDWAKFNRKPIDIDEAVKLKLGENGIFDNYAKILFVGYIKLWEYFTNEARGIVADVLGELEY